MSRDPLVFIIAGEPSGDRIGAGIIKALRDITKKKIRISGIGGEHMEAQGLKSLFPMKDLSLMGMVEIIPQLPKIYRRYRQTINAIKYVKPDVILTIDSPDFCLRIAKKAKTLGYPVIHYTAPTVWAWRPGRAAKMAKYIDHLLLLYRFERKYFDEVGLPNTFVGHPLCTSNVERQGSQAFREKHKIGATKPILCILPGSRRAEVIKLMPHFHEALKKISEKYPKLQFVLPVAPQVKDIVNEALRTWDLPVLLVEGERDKHGAMKASKVALAASGTVTLELAMAELPTIITYVMNPITVWLGRKLAITKYIGLPNIILNKAVIPELIQQDCNSDEIFKRLDRLLSDKSARDNQIKNFKVLRDELMLYGRTPSEMAADVILDMITEKPKVVEK